ncbi:MAG: TetR/AcrR family transcriptional regulator, partial [Actinomycetes bacterium]
MQARRAQARRAILDSAWRLASGSGLDALSLREIAASVGMRAPSLYSYFPNKAAILDALFIDGYHALDIRIAEVVEALPAKASPGQRLGRLLRAWVGFCQADPARYQLLFTSAVPGWQPSADAYAASLASYARLCDYLALAGITDPDDVDLCTALSAGLIAQQMANDPHGDRWLRRGDQHVHQIHQPPPTPPRPAPPHPPQDTKKHHPTPP